MACDTVNPMAMTLRLEGDLQERVREAALRAGCSQQQLIKDVLDAGLAPLPTKLERLLEAGEAQQPRRRRGSSAKWRASVDSSELLDREDRV